MDATYEQLVPHALSSRLRAPRIALAPEECRAMSASIESDLSDENLAQQAAAGDMDAYERIYHRHKDAVAVRLFAMLRNAHDTEELVQETFIAAHRALESYRAFGSFAGWLQRIARNCALMAMRRNQRLTFCDPAEMAALQDQAHGTSPVEPFEQATRGDLEVEVRDAVQSLPRELHESFRLVVLEGGAYRDVAQRLGISVSLVKIRVFRAREFLKAQLHRHLTGGKARP